MGGGLHVSVKLDPGGVKGHGYTKRKGGEMGPHTDCSPISCVDSPSMSGVVWYGVAHVTYAVYSIIYTSYLSCVSLAQEDI